MALQFEWAWQNPQKSLRVRAAFDRIKKHVGKRTFLQAKVRVMFEMLHLKPWSTMPLRVVHLSEYGPPPLSPQSLDLPF